MTLRAAGRAVAVAVTIAALSAAVFAADRLGVVQTSVEVMGSRVEAGDRTLYPTLGTDGAVRGSDPSGEATDTRTGAGAETARAPGPTGTGVWALVVGVDNYPSPSPDLRAGVTDALDMDAALAKLAVPDAQRRVLLEADATRDAVLAGFDWLAANAGPQATVVLFFSGHVRQVAGDPDADGEDVDEGMVFSDGALIFDGELRTILERVVARRMWLNIAGCYAGGFDDAMAPGRVLTAASPEGVLAYENDRMRRTYLVEYMVRRAMIEGAAAGSVQEAFGWAVEALRRDYPSRLPVIFDQLGEPLVIGPAATAPRPVVDKAPPPPSLLSVPT